MFYNIIIILIIRMASFKTLKALIILKKINIWYFSSAKELGTVSEKHRNPKPEENNPIF